jgi:serine O-acetyltransferase
VLENMRRDLQAALERDPAARSRAEIVLCYPGVWAVWGHRLAHRLWRANLKLAARAISHVMRTITGIEIHPGAVVGPGLFIDHGMGVVIGETTEIGADVTLYQGVTLGGTSLAKGKRHPTLGDRVVIGAGAKVLGAITVGECARVGANAVVVKSVPPNAVVVGVPGEVVASKEATPAGRVPDLEHGRLPDVLGDTVAALVERVNELEQRLNGAHVHRHEAPFTHDHGVWREGDDSPA